MTGHVYVQDALGHIFTAREIQIGADVKHEKITIERLELYLGEPSGVELRPGRVHALSTVRRRLPFYLLPPRPGALLNHSTELEALRQPLIDFKTADLYGLDGMGKSALVGALAHALDMDHFADGAVFVTGHIPYQDLLQVLFENFYESDSPVKITQRHAPSYLYNLEALIILDDVVLGPKQIDPILDALGNSAVLIAGSERTAVGRGHAVPLKGLPREEAIALFERALLRGVSPDERPIVDQICETLNDAPLPISCVAAQLAKNQSSLNKLLTDLQGRKPWAGPGGDLSVGPSLEQLVLALGALDRQLLILAATFAGPSASSEALETLMNLPTSDFNEHAECLQALGLLYGESDEPSPDPLQMSRLAILLRSRGGIAPRLALPPAYRQAVRTWLVDDAARLEIANHYVTRLTRGDRLPGAELPNLLGAIEDCAHNGWLAALKTLTHAVDRTLASLGWWACWEHALDLTRRAAQTGGDRALEAWAMHQLGSLLGAQGISVDGRDDNSERALHLLRTAWNMRQALGDETGSTLSARNLEVLERVLPPPIQSKAIQPLSTAAPATNTAAPEPQQAPPPSPAKKGKSFRPQRWLAGVALSVFLLTIALGLWLALGNRSSDGDASPRLTVSWAFGDAWNTLDNQNWTQQIVIVVENGTGDYQYFADGQPVGRTFEITLSLCDGAQGIIQVESKDGPKGQVEYAFDSPYCP